MVRRRGADRTEIGAPLLERHDEIIDVRDRRAVQALELGELGTPARQGDPHQRVGAEGRHNVLRAALARLAHGLVVLERIGGGVGRRQTLHVEAREERARPELWRLELLADLIVDALAGVAAELYTNTEQLVQLV